MRRVERWSNNTHESAFNIPFFADTQIGKAAALKPEEGEFIYFRALPFLPG